MRKYCKFLVIAIVLSASSSLDAQSRQERVGASNARQSAVQPQHRGRPDHGRGGYAWRGVGYGWSSGYRPYGWSGGNRPYGWSGGYRPYGWSSGYSPYGWSGGNRPYGWGAYRPVNGWIGSRPGHGPSYNWGIYRQQSR